MMRLSYIKMFKGYPFERYCDANCRTDCIELISNSITSSFAFGIFSTMLSFTFLPDSRFLTGIMTCTPRKASTRVVSNPIPLVAPESHIKYGCKRIEYGLMDHAHICFIKTCYTQIWFII